MTTAPAASRLLRHPESSSLPAPTDVDNCTCTKVRKVGDSLKFISSREGTISLKVFCDCYRNLGMAGGSLVSAAMSSKQQQRLRVQSRLRKPERRGEGCQTFKGLR